jgi:bifunctional ADP-heptose synthase (sugar kinase/adenylyltransferase)
LDTRTKILEPAEALETARRWRSEGKGLKVIVGCFDPVLADNARRVAALRDPSTALAVVVADPPRPILPARARAELVAALSAVDLVVVPGDVRLDELLAGLGAAEIVRSEDADQRLTESLIHHVRSRHSSV